MSIVVACKNGHRLVARDSRAGTVGRCPACGVEVKIPEATNAPPSDSSILRILGIGQELRKGMADADAQESKAQERQGQSAPINADELGTTFKTQKSTPKKICPKCDWEIDAGYKICPKCRYYFVK